MRPRGAAASARRTRSGIHPVYEDFKPTSEWKHEDGADIILYHLPGFAKEQIRIIAESKGILRVRGERLVTSNRWSRFQEEVVVPKDCNMSEIRAKFEGGILRIMMPKKAITTDKKNPIDERSSTTSNEPPTSSTVARPNLQTKPQPELPDELSTKPAFPSIAEKPQPKMQQEATVPPVKPPVDLEKPQNNQDDSGEGKSKEMPASKVAENEVRDDNHEEAISGKLEKHEKNADALDQDKSSLSELDKNSRSGSHRKVTSLISKKLSEDRQLLMNMGAAALVIVALGTQIAYSFGSWD